MSEHGAYNEQATSKRWDKAQLSFEPYDKIEPEDGMKETKGGKNGTV